MKKILFFVLALVAIAACEDSRPLDILSMGKMEDVLYDYHIAQSMIEQLPYEQREKLSQAYVDAVFEKHSITETEFDSSLVWYNRHATDLVKIYNNLQGRFEEDNQKLSLTTGNEVMAVMSQNGDTTNIWSGAKMFVLRSKAGINRECFSFDADSSFRKQDHFMLICQPNIICENADDHDNYINIGLTVMYKDGESSGSSLRAMSKGETRINVYAKEGKEIASVNGYFYYKGKDDLRNLAVVSGIGLIRMHTIEEERKVEKLDSITHDSLPVVQPQKVRQHLSPEEMRRQNQSEEKIKIKAAPEVRTPNSYGPRRRTVTSPRR